MRFNEYRPRVVLVGMQDPKLTFRDTPLRMRRVAGIMLDEQFGLVNAIPDYQSPECAILGDTGSDMEMIQAPGFQDRLAS